MVFRIGLQIVNVDAWQTRYEQLEFLLVENGDEGLGNDLVEALQETLDLGADGSSHLHLAGELDILPLVGLCDRKFSPVGLEVSDLCLPKLLNLLATWNKQWTKRDNQISLAEHFRYSTLSPEHSEQHGYRL